MVADSPLGGYWTNKTLPCFICDVSHSVLCFFPNGGNKHSKSTVAKIWPMLYDLNDTPNAVDLPSSVHSSATNSKLQVITDFPGP